MAQFAGASLESAVAVTKHTQFINLENGHHSFYLIFFFFLPPLFGRKDSQSASRVTAFGE